MPIESRGAQATRTPDDGTDTRAFPASEDAAKQRTRARAKNGVLNALSASTTRFNGAFYVYLLAGRRMIHAIIAINHPLSTLEKVGSFFACIFRVVNSDLGALLHPFCDIFPTVFGGVIRQPKG